MADRNDADTDSADPPSTSMADDSPAAPVDTASTQISSELKEAVKDVLAATETVDKVNDETFEEHATRSTEPSSAAKQDEPSTEQSDEKAKEEATTGSKPAIQKDESAQSSHERSRKRTRESNVKSDLTSQPISSDPVAIRKQVGNEE